MVKLVVAAVFAHRVVAAKAHYDEGAVYLESGQVCDRKSQV
ncbi:MAG: hypothetical protein QOG23_2882 [Blastocatellia bacterium]|jgi:hypothetical protein|nr:hypothetical protein [Blastocatellia bacterium]